MDEPTEIVDKKGKVLSVLSRSEVIERNLRFKVAIIIVRNSNGDFLITQRHRTKKVNPLLWNVGAGGGVDEGEDFLTAAKRELLEEVGIASKDTDLNFCFDFSYTGESCYEAKVFALTHSGPVHYDPQEIEQTRWITREDLLSWCATEKIAPDTQIFIKQYLNGSY